MTTAEQVVAQARRYNFFAAVALLERLTPDAPRVGGLGPVADEAVRFRHDPALVFSAGDVREITLKPRASDPFGGARQPVFEVVTTFLGLTGAASPLPLYIAEEVATEDPDAAAQRDFLDVFHHRVLSLFYRAHGRFDYPNEYLSDQSDPWSRRVLALAGLDAFEQPPPTRLPRWRLLRLAPLLAAHARSARTLELALEDVLGDELEGATVRIEQFAARWVEIDRRQRMALGVANTHLGRNTTLGVRIQDCGGKFRVVIGPLTDQNYRRLAPGGDLLPVVRDVVSLFCRDTLECDLELVLRGDGANTFRLSRTDGARLGKDTWLGRRRDQTRVVVDLPFDLPPPPVAEPAAGRSPYDDGDGRAPSEPPAERTSGVTFGDARDPTSVPLATRGSHHAR